MKIVIEPKAAQWFKEEVGIREGYGIQFKSKIYGNSPINEGFGLSVDIDIPNHPATTTEENGILFFIEEEDTWFFGEHDLLVSYDETYQEPKYIYLKNGKPVQENNHN